MVAILGGIALWSGLDANGAYEDFRSDASKLTEDQARDRADQGKAKDTRTNVILGATAAVAVVTGGIALFAVHWGSDEAATVGVSPGQLVLRGRF
jgi:hypothetical protein